MQAGTNLPEGAVNRRRTGTGDEEPVGSIDPPAAAMEEVSRFDKSLAQSLIRLQHEDVFNNIEEDELAWADPPMAEEGHMNSWHGKIEMTLAESRAQDNLRLAAVAGGAQPVNPAFRAPDARALAATILSYLTWLFTPRQLRKPAEREAFQLPDQVHIPIPMLPELLRPWRHVTMYVFWRVLAVAIPPR